MERPMHQQLGMTDDELADVESELGREPTDLELAMYAVMWSEHCSYKSSRAHLPRFPTTAPWVLVGPGEGAGVVDIGDGIAVAVRIESHNHPSAVEPYEGAATGVGGIIRDIFSMGARPLALMDPLRFGRLDDARTRYLFEGGASGTGGYGNSVGVPAVGVQDLGAAGLSCAASETAAKAGVGMDVDVARVAKREPGMNAVEVMTSESQERMLAIVEPARLDEVLELARKWEIRATVVGRVTDSDRFRVFDGSFDALGVSGENPSPPLGA